jgi:membrane protein
MNERSVGALLKSTLRNWMDDNAMRLAAALAFYTVWSIGPLFLVVVSVVGLAYGRAAAQGHVVDSLRQLVGDAGAHSIEDAIVHANGSGNTVLANVVGIVMLLISASGVVAELKASLDLVWDVTPRPGSFFITLKDRFFSLTMVLGTGFLLLVSLLFNAALSAIGTRLRGHVPGGEGLWHVVHFVVSFGLTSLLFCLIFKVVPDAKVRWKDVWIGGVVTAALFTLGQALIGIYVGKTNIGSAYGAASSVMIILVWVFFSSCILFLGAEFTRVYANMYGSQIEPTKNAIHVPRGMTPVAAIKRRSPSAR